MKIGVAIPCYKGHITALKALLDSIAQQTRLPDDVFISCSSSVPSDFPYQASDYPFPLRVLTHNIKQTVAQNRNIAGALVHGDIITFFDADDQMHPQRLEIIEDCFTKHNSMILVHDFDADIPSYKEFPIYAEFPYRLNQLERCPWGSTVLKGRPAGLQVHNGQPSIRREVFDTIRFNESAACLMKDDTVFCTDVIMKWPDRTAYCPLKLSAYTPSFTGGFKC
jgi:glycosyltransferase involved in cell wall biosynthesis